MTSHSSKKIFAGVGNSPTHPPIWGPKLHWILCTSSSVWNFDISALACKKYHAWQEQGSGAEWFFRPKAGNIFECVFKSRSWTSVICQNTKITCFIHIHRENYAQAWTGSIFFCASPSLYLTFIIWDFSPPHNRVYHILKQQINGNFTLKMSYIFRVNLSRKTVLFAVYNKKIWFVRNSSFEGWVRWCVDYFRNIVAHSFDVYKRSKEFLLGFFPSLKVFSHCYGW